MHLDLQDIKDKACFALSISDIMLLEMLEGSLPYSGWFTQDLKRSFLLVLISETLY